MIDTVQCQAENHPAWEDWEDQGGFDDEEALMGMISPKRSAAFPERPWYYEKNWKRADWPLTFGVQLSFF